MLLSLLLLIKSDTMGQLAKEGTAVRPPRALPELARSKVRKGCFINALSRESSIWLPSVCNRLLYNVLPPHLTAHLEVPSNDSYQFSLNTFSTLLHPLFLLFLT